MKYKLKQEAEYGIFFKKLKLTPREERGRTTHVKEEGKGKTTEREKERGKERGREREKEGEMERKK